MSAARFRLPPLCVGVDGAEVSAWLARAAAGERIVYARGRDGNPKMPAMALMRAASDRGEVFLWQARGADGINEYHARRLGGPADATLAAAAAAGTPAGAAGSLRGELAQCYALLRAAAEDGAACPSNREIAAALFLRNEAAVRYRLRQLKSMGHIDVLIDGEGLNAGRVVVIAETGARTAPRGGAAAAGARV